MNVGTGKITKEEMRSVPHYLLDFTSPKEIFTVTQYRKLALKALSRILSNGKTPIVCGGTGFYIQAIVDGIVIPRIEPDWPLRKRLDKLSTEKLFDRLKKYDQTRARKIDKNNRRRLIRSLEIVIKTKRPIPELKKNPLLYPVLIIGIKKVTESKMKRRINRMFEQGLEKEVKNLVNKYGWVPALQTIGYQEWKEYFEGKINRKQVKDLIILHTKQYAKRQMTWFKRDKRIHWIKNQEEAERLIRSFLQNRKGSLA
jgi:tRNA dimethylallyltransferase